jgi:hypothetical protein
VARRALSQARLPVSFQQTGEGPKDGPADFQLAGTAGSIGIPQRNFHLRWRGYLRADAATLFRSLPHAGQTRGGRWRRIFPPFENKFELAGEIHDAPEFKILHYRRRSLASSKD